MTKSREYMSGYIAEWLYDGLDIKRLLREEYDRIVEDLATWPDQDIKDEYDSLTNG